MFMLRAVARNHNVVATAAASLVSKNTDSFLGTQQQAASCKIKAGGKELCKTGISIKMPPGVYGRVAPRSGLAWKKHIDVGAGVIDADYRGNVGVVLFNHGEEDLEDDVEGDLRLPRAEQRGDGDEPLARLLVERRRPSTLGRPEASC